MTKFISPSEWYKFLDQDSGLYDWSFDITPEDVKKYCSHKFVEMGFMHSKLVCKFCDLSKEDWEAFLKSQENKDVQSGTIA